MDCATTSTAVSADRLTPALAATLLLAVPLEARHTLWRGLTRALEGALWLWEAAPTSRRAPPPLALRHLGPPYFNPGDLRRQSQEGLHRLLRLELPLTVDVLEALLWGQDDKVPALLADQCARVGQLYAELKRRAGEAVALLILQGELRLLRYRASSVVAPIVFSWGVGIAASAV